MNVKCVVSYMKKSFNVMKKREKHTQINFWTLRKERERERDRTNEFLSIVSASPVAQQKARVSQKPKNEFVTRSVAANKTLLNTRALIKKSLSCK